MVFTLANDANASIVFFVKAHWDRYCDKQVRKILPYNHPPEYIKLKKTKKIINIWIIFLNSQCQLKWLVEIKNILKKKKKKSSLLKIRKKIVEYFFFVLN